MLVYMFHISSGLSCMAIFVAPILLDFWITPPTVSTPNPLSSVMGAPSSTKRAACINQCIRRDAMQIERERDRERLHDRAGLERVGQDAVAQLLAGQA